MEARMRCRGRGSMGGGTAASRVVAAVLALAVAWSPQAFGGVLTSGQVSPSEGEDWTTSPYGDAQVGWSDWGEVTISNGSEAYTGDTFIGGDAYDVGSGRIHLTGSSASWRC